MLRLGAGVLRGAADADGLGDDARLARVAAFGAALLVGQHRGLLQEAVLERVAAGHRDQALDHGRAGVALAAGRQLEQLGGLVRLVVAQDAGAALGRGLGAVEPEHAVRVRGVQLADREADVAVLAALVVAGGRDADLDADEPTVRAALHGSELPLRLIQDDDGATHENLLKWVRTTVDERSRNAL